MTHKHTPEITPEERADLMDEARRPATSWEAIGAECDRSNRFPTESVEAYMQSAITSMAVPRRLGGLAADMLTVAQVGRELAKGDPAIALSYNMHQAMVGIFPNTPALDDATRDRVLGKKNWSTLVEGSDIIALNATITDADGSVPEDFREHAKREATFIIATVSPNLSVDHTWDTMGMRATGSHTIVLDGVYAGPETFGGNFRQGLVGEAEWAAMLFAGVYRGLADKAYAETVEILKTKHLGATLSAQDTDLKNLGYL